LTKLHNEKCLSAELLTVSKCDVCSTYSCNPGFGGNRYSGGRSVEAQRTGNRWPKGREREWVFWGGGQPYHLGPPDIWW